MEILTTIFIKFNPIVCGVGGNVIAATFLSKSDGLQRRDIDIISIFGIAGRIILTNINTGGATFNACRN